MITLGFKQPPKQMFDLEPGVHFTSNELTIDFADPGSIAVGFLAKEPGPSRELGPAQFTFNYRESFNSSLRLEAYQRLIHDVMLGDRTVFTTASGVEWVWEVSTPLLEHPPPIQPYAVGSWGPEAANKLIATYRWHSRLSTPGHSPPTYLAIQAPRSAPSRHTRATRSRASAVAIQGSIAHRRQ